MQGRNAIVTGGLGALGREVALRFLKGGARVAIPMKTGDRPPASLDATGNALYLEVADLTAEEEVRRFVENASGALGPITILVNAAGGYAGGEAIGEVTPSTLDSMLAMNLRSAFYTCNAVLPAMRSQSYGRIINIAAMPALVPTPRRGPYAIAKRGVITLTETIAEEVKGTGITANAIAPSIMLTPANEASMPGADTSAWVTPAELADLVVFLCSESARSISGNVIKAYGGV